MLVLRIYPALNSRYSKESELEVSDIRQPKNVSHSASHWCVSNLLQYFITIVINRYPIGKWCQECSVLTIRPPPLLLRGICRASTTIYSSHSPALPRLLMHRLVVGAPRRSTTPLCLSCLASSNCPHRVSILTSSIAADRYVTIPFRIGKVSRIT
jgi:hypothetical protein